MKIPAGSSEQRCFFFFLFFFFGSLEPDVLHVFYIFVHFNQKVFAFLKATRGFIVSVIIGPVTVLQINPRHPEAFPPRPFSPARR